MSDSYRVILQKNRIWAERKRREDPLYFKKLSRPQRPEYLYIGCSDSRVAAEEMMGLQPGEVFVHRNVANLVDGLDLNVSSAIQYAVSTLKVNHIIICGHYNCGGIRAAMLPEDQGLLNPWLRNIRDVYRLHRDELDAIANEQQRYNRLVELNVQEQCINVIKMACVQERYVADGYPVVHGWVFDMGSGHIRDLNIDFAELMSDIQRIYDITDTRWVANANLDKVA